MAFVIGITGGIGSGKSTVSEILRICGIPVYIADDESKRLTNSSTEIKKELINLFGSEIYLNGKLNKELLSSHIFTNKEFLQKVNAIIHPVVKDDFNKWVSAFSRNNSIVAIESAILFEAGFEDVINTSILVHTPLDLRIKRMLKRDNTSVEKIMNRIQNQMPDDEKINYVDYIIRNDEEQSLIEQTIQIIDNLH